MHMKLAESLDFTRNVDKGAEIHGKWPISSLSGLSDLLLNDQGDLDVSLYFGRQAKWSYVKGTVTGNLAVTCQRCMQPMELALDTQFSLALVRNEDEADLLPEEFEPLMLEDEILSLSRLLEEELLLAIPLVAMHDTECSDVLVEQKQWQAENESLHKKENPFSVLKDLIK